MTWMTTACQGPKLKTHEEKNNKKPWIPLRPERTQFVILHVVNMTIHLKNIANFHTEFNKALEAFLQHILIFFLNFPFRYVYFVMSVGWSILFSRWPSWITHLMSIVSLMKGQCWAVLIVQFSFFKATAWNLKQCNKSWATRLIQYLHTGWNNYVLGDSQLSSSRVDVRRWKPNGI